MSRLVEIVARAINIAQGIHGYKDDTHWREHWQWYLDGKDDPSSCVQYSTLAYGERYARAAIAAVVEDMRADLFARRDKAELTQPQFVYCREMIDGYAAENGIEVKL